jgi:hypothetical protein
MVAGAGCFARGKDGRAWPLGPIDFRGVQKTVKYNHLGIPTQTPKEGEIYLPDFDIYCTDHESNPFGIQWMRYGEKCTLPRIVQEVAHVAFEVENLAEALEGKEVIIEPNSPSEGVMVAFVLEDGAPVELMEYAAG